MRTVARFSILFSVLSALLALILHIRATTGEWAGMPYRADILVYPNIWLDRWSVGAAVAGVIFLGYFFVAMHFIKNEDNLTEEIRRFESLKVLNGK